MKELKFLYETTVQKQVEDKVKEQQEQNGEKVEVTRTVKKLHPIKLGVLKPNRKLFEAAEIFYAKTINDLLKMGLLPYSLVAKRYSNDGGALSEPDKARLEVLKNEIKAIEERYYFLAPSQETADIKEKGDILEKLNDLNKEAAQIQNAYASIFDNTVEAKARNRLIEWWTLNLSFITEDNTVLKPLFGEGTYDDKLNKYDDFEDVQDPFYIDCIQRLSFLISFWLSARTVIQTFDFKGMEKLFQENNSNYHPEETTDVKVSTPDDTKKV